MLITNDGAYGAGSHAEYEARPGEPARWDWVGDIPETRACGELALPAGSVVIGHSGHCTFEAEKRGRACTLRLIVFMGAAACAALSLGGGAWLAGLLWRC
ncbi:hypothetical protein OG195_43125 (plasmid) [Streptomyces sp. NBC_01362]|uniref:hypothetical protein n=1 Tax=unclassified Streptomyces TaxID=2593676 RepID=UPI002E334301|nr:hypothetical protein [Streptomyces sp. NBC_01362]